VVSSWFAQKTLLLNPDKTEVVIFGTRQWLANSDPSRGINITGTNVCFNNSLKSLGVTFDATLSFDKHESNVVRTCTFHTRVLRHIRLFLTVEAAKTHVAPITGIRLDYCNSLLLGSTERNLQL